jgi:Tfp pilus assembly protein FimT
MRWRRVVCRPRGATAVELLILVMVLLILAAFAIPGMSPVVLQQRLRGAAWQVAGDLRLARQRAVTVRKRFRVCVTKCAIREQAGTYSVERDEGTPSKPVWVSDAGTLTKLPESIAVTTSATPVFQTNGMASGSTFTLSNAIGKYEVRVASTGRVLVCLGGCSP